MLTKKAVVVTEFNNLPVTGDAAELLPEVVNWLSVNWEGHADSVVSAKREFHSTAFDPVDKGGIGMFGLNKHGKIILGMVKYDGDARSPEAVERKPHYFCKKTDCANSWL